MKNYANTIRDWPEQERPRERLLLHGAESLAEAELIGIILRTGNGKRTALDLGRQLLTTFDGLRGLDAQPAEELCKIPGIGTAKAAQVKAALELAKRLAMQKSRERFKVNSSQDLYELMRWRLQDLSREAFYVIYLSLRNEIITEKQLFTGSLSESTVSPREIIVSALQYAAASVILLHNHPSGNPLPSTADKNVTRKICHACHYADVQVLDHIIIGKDGYYSFADEGLMSV